MTAPFDAELGRLSVVLGGRRIDDPYDRLRRACGLGGSAGPGTATRPSWPRDADAPTGDDDRIRPGDVATIALGDPTVTAADVAELLASTPVLERWLAGAPSDRRVADADPATIDHLAGLRTAAPGASLPVLTELLHRKRPLLVPLTNPRVADWYRRYTGAGDLRASWPALVRGIAFDLRQPSNALALALMGVRLTNELGRAPDTLRRVQLLIDAGRPPQPDTK